MKKLVVECVKVHGWEKAFLKVVEQPGIRNEFCTGGEFRASNGWTIKSQMYPEIYSGTKEFYVWGDSLKERDNVITCSLTDADEIRNAVQEYNLSPKYIEVSTFAEFLVFK